MFESDMGLSTCSEHSGQLAMLGAITEVGTDAKGFMLIDEGIHLCRRHVHLVQLSKPVANVMAVDKERNHVIFETLPVVIKDGHTCVDFSHAF